VWRALNNNRSIHPAWAHLASHPLTEENLPRPIETVDVKVVVPTEAAPNKMRGCKPVVEVAACTSSHGVCSVGICFVCFVTGNACASSSQQCKSDATVQMDCDCPDGC
jgi:hypothetical protein